VAPAQVLFASDAPYGSVVQSVIVTLRCALEAGLSPEQVRQVAGARLASVLEGGDLASTDCGPPPEKELSTDPLLARVSDNLASALARRVVGDDGLEPIALARLCCAVPDDHPQRRIMSSVLDLIDRAEAHRTLPEDERLRFSDLHVLATALTVSRTPHVPVPDPQAGGLG
jgi:hypothetical protein